IVIFGDAAGGAIGRRRRLTGIGITRRGLHHAAIVLGTLCLGGHHVTFGFALVVVRLVRTADDAARWGRGATAVRDARGGGSARYADGGSALFHTFFGRLLLAFDLAVFVLVFRIAAGGFGTIFVVHVALEDVVAVLVAHDDPGAAWVEAKQCV